MDLTAEDQFEAALKHVCDEHGAVLVRAADASFPLRLFSTSSSLIAKRLLLVILCNDGSGTEKGEERASSTRKLLLMGIQVSEAVPFSRKKEKNLHVVVSFLRLADEEQMADNSISSSNGVWLARCSDASGADSASAWEAQVHSGFTSWNAAMLSGADMRIPVVCTSEGMSINICTRFLFPEQKKKRETKREEDFLSSMATPSSSPLHKHQGLISADLLPCEQDEQGGASGGESNSSNSSGQVEDASVYSSIEKRISPRRRLMTLSLCGDE